MARMTSTLSNSLRFTLQKALLNYMLMLTRRLQGYHISFLQALHQRYHIRVIGFHPKENFIWGFGYPNFIQDPPSGYWFSPEKFLYGTSFIRVLCKILLRDIGFHPEAN